MNFIRNVAMEFMFIFEYIQHFFIASWLTVMAMKLNDSFLTPEACDVAAYKFVIVEYF